MTATNATTTATTTTISRPTRIRAAIAGVLLALVIAHPAAAVSWSGDAHLTATENYQPQILRTGATSAIAIWQHGMNVYARRTADGGTTWAPTQTLVTGIWFTVSAASSGANVDLAYVKQITNSDGSTSRRLYHKRSTNGGATFGSAHRMTSLGSNIGDQAIARHSNGQVSIAWIGLTSGNIYMRTSIDGGVTFAAARYVGHSKNSEIGRTVMYRGDLELAIGTGVTYLAYTSAHDTVAVRRTLNRGVSWSSAKVLNTSAGTEYSLVASGQQGRHRLHQQQLGRDEGPLPPDHRQGRDLVGQQAARGRADRHVQHAARVLVPIGRPGRDLQVRRAGRLADLDQGKHRLRNDVVVTDASQRGPCRRQRPRTCGHRGPRLDPPRRLQREPQRPG